jgi:uncharacterized protein YecA (UPF0149 family)
MAAKRERMRRAAGEQVTLTVPLAMAAKLRARKPFGRSFKQFLLQILSESNRLAAPARESLVKPVVGKPAFAALAVVGRNERCPCGSGLKWKRCCGAPGRAV